MRLLVLVLAAWPLMAIEVGAQDLDARLAIMEMAIHRDSEGWGVNQYIVGSARNPRIVAAEGGVTVVRVDYEYQNDYTNPYNPWREHRYDVGWAEGRFTDYAPDCIRFFDRPEVCEDVPSERELYAWARSTWFIADAGLDTFEGDLPGLIDARDKGCIRRRAEDFQVLGGVSAATWGTFLYRNSCGRPVTLTFRADDGEGGWTDARDTAVVPENGSLRLQCKRPDGARTVCGTRTF